MWHESKSEPIPQKVAVRDCAFLAGISAIAGLFYINSLGFYADDWYVWSRFGLSKDQSLGALLRRLPLSGTLQEGLGARPASALMGVLAYSKFGLDPLPYHACISLMLVAVVVVFYLALRELRLPHFVALVVPLVYGLLPHYASDRFWLAGLQAFSSQALFFLGLYVAARSLRAVSWASFYLQLLSISSFMLVLLFYEVVLPLLSVAVLAVGCCIYAKSCSNGVKRSISAGKSLGYLLVAALGLGSVILYKARMTNRVNLRFTHQSLNFGQLTWNVIRMTAKFNFLHYGVGLPRVAFKMYLFSGLELSSAIIIVVITVSVLLYLNLLVGHAKLPLLGRNYAFCVVAAGLLIFLICYLPFFLLNSNFSYDGTNNRVTIAAAIGAAFVLTGGIMALIAMLPVKLQRVSICGALTTICALNAVCIASLGHCWAQASTQQREIIAGVRKNVNVSPGSSVLLDGFCRYVGPAPVFENAFDAGGALRSAYRDDMLQADVVSPALIVGDKAIANTFYGVRREYVYGDSLWLYNVGKNIALRLTSAQVAREYFSTVNPDKDSGCPAGVEGMGSPMG